MIIKAQKKKKEIASIFNSGKKAANGPSDAATSTI